MIATEAIAGDRPGFPVETSSTLRLLSHELRGPTAVIVGYARMLSAGQIDPDASPRILKQIEEAATRISRLSAEASDIGRWLEPAGHRTPVDADLALLLDRAIAASQIGDRLEKDYSPDAESWRIKTADADAVAAALATALKAAARESPEGALTLRVRSCDGNLVEIFVGNAAGVPAERLAQGPTDPPLVSRGGLGLSLVLAWVILDAHHARMWSPADQRGSIAILIPVKE